MRSLHVVNFGHYIFADFQQVYYIRAINADEAEIVLRRVTDVPDGTPVYVTRRAAQEDLGCWRALKRAR